MRGAIAIIDSGGANIASLVYALQRLGTRAELTGDPDRIRRAERVILPGVGAARDAMTRLAGLGLAEAIPRLERPVLGICLGMQLLAEDSEEDEVDCLAIIPGQARRLDSRPGMPVPNMGWCPVRQSGSHAILDGVGDNAWFYFVHSYALAVGDYTVATAEHSRDFSAVAARDNFVATQFHPERSAAAGARLLDNFIRWSP